MNIQLTLEKSESINLIKTETIYEQPFYSPNIDFLSISENLYQKKISQSPRKWIEDKKQITPRKIQTQAHDHKSHTQFNNKDQSQGFQKKLEMIKIEENEQKQFTTRAKTLFNKQKSLCMKKYLKLIGLVVIAIVRIKRISNQSVWKKYKSQYNNIIFYVKLELIQNKRINDWCKAVCARSLTSVTEELHDFILSPNDKYMSDISLMKCMNACKFLMENLIMFSAQPKYFCLELKNFIFTQIFLDHKRYFTRFVSLRTLYMSATNRKIEKEELTMILVESILLNSIINNILDSNQTCLFFLKIIISVLQFLFLRTFYRISKKKQRNQINLSTFEFVQKEKKLVLDKREISAQTITSQNQSDDIILSLYDEEALRPLLKYKKGFQKQLQQQFEKFACNLYATVLE